MLKNARKPLHEPVNAYERALKRRQRPERKLHEHIRKTGAKLKKEGYPSRFISEKEEQTHD